MKVWLPPDTSHPHECVNVNQCASRSLVDQWPFPGLVGAWIESLIPKIREVKSKPLQNTTHIWLTLKMPGTLHQQAWICPVPVFRCVSTWKSSQDPTALFLFTAKCPKLQSRMILHWDEWTLRYKTVPNQLCQSVLSYLYTSLLLSTCPAWGYALTALPWAVAPFWPSDF